MLTSQICLLHAASLPIGSCTTFYTSSVRVLAGKLAAAIKSIKVCLPLGSGIPLLVVCP